MHLVTKVLSPLEKVFYTDSLTRFKTYKTSTALIGEFAAFEVAYYADEYAENSYQAYDCFAAVQLYCNGKEIDSSCAVLSAVEHMPSVYAGVSEKDPDDYIKSEPGLYPDMLVPLTKDKTFTILPRLTGTLWVSIDTENLEGGNYTAVVTITDENRVTVAAVEHKIKIIPARLPKQKIAVTQWIHTDCIADYYNIEVFSKDYWTAVRNTVKTAVKYGTNMIYTPLFTPPLDTNPGKERTTVQLVDVHKTADGYSFGFDKLRKWVDICRECGAEYFEMSHLFTQWGARHAPKIMADEKQLFGWDTDADGDEYKNFLSQFLPELCSEIKHLGIADKTVFHISDEPALEHLESYRAASKTIHKYIGDFKVMDAMSEPIFYEEGLVDIPVPHVVHENKFAELRLNPHWIYYCGSNKNCMGRTFGMHSARNRISGTQFYICGADGFLHWGFNFYNAARSVRRIDPFAVTDAGMKFVSGDSFMVYPAPNFELYNSIRLEVFRQGIDDMRALQLCESLYSREIVESVLTEVNGGEQVALHKIPKDTDFTLKMRKKINKMIAKEINGRKNV